ncbi:MAG: radical SAM protein [Acidobacteriota bacterium]
MATTALMARIGEATNRTLVLPIVMFAPTHRCNSACVSCSWWSTTTTSTVPGRGELTLAEIEVLATDLAKMGTRLVVFTGGEPLLRPDVFDAARMFQRRGITLHLLTSGLGLEPRIASVAGVFKRVIISLDSTTPEGYRAIRGVDGLDAVQFGVHRLRSFAPHVPVSARATIHALNFREMPQMVAAARAMGCASVSFLPADLGSAAFGERDLTSLQSLRLSRKQVDDFRIIVDALIRDHEADIASGFIAESPMKLRQIAQYYAAMNGDGGFPPKSCNAPWMSAVIEANGDVRPCFFHDVVGNIRRDRISHVARTALPRFREGLDVATNATCATCVCSLKLKWRDQPWA